MADYSYPTSDSVTGDWTTAPLYAKVDDSGSANSHPTQDDSDYISFNGLTGTTACVLGLSTISTPDTDRAMVLLRVRARHTGKEGATLTATLKDSGGTTVVAFTKSVLPQDFMTFSRSLTADEKALASSWASMTLTLAYSGTGVCDVSQVFVENEGVEDQMGQPVSHKDMENGGYCSVKGYWYPASQLKTVDGQRVWKGTGRKNTKYDR